MVRIKGHSDLGDFDREDTNRSDGQHFYGHDGDDGKTDWYREDGTLDSTSDTPSDDEDD
jgi:hypothetical protein